MLYDSVYDGIIDPPSIHSFIDCVVDNYLFLYSLIPKTFFEFVLLYAMVGPDSAIQPTEHVKRTEERPRRTPKLLQLVHRPGFRR